MQRLGAYMCENANTYTMSYKPYYEIDIILLTLQTIEQHVVHEYVQS